MKKIKSLLIILTTLSCGCICASASEDILDTQQEQTVYAEAYVGNNNLTVNNGRTYRQYPPIIDEESGCMMISVDWLSLITNIRYETDPEDGKVTFYRNTFYMTFTPESDEIYLAMVQAFYDDLYIEPLDEPREPITYEEQRDWSDTYYMLAPARQIDGTMYLPLRNVLEILGYTVEWSEEKQGVDIYEPDYSKLLEVEAYYDPMTMKYIGDRDYIIKNNSYLPVASRVPGNIYENTIYRADGTKLFDVGYAGATVITHMIYEPFSTTSTYNESVKDKKIMYRKGLLPEGDYYQVIRRLMRYDFAGVAVEIPEQRIYFTAPKADKYLATELSIGVKDGHTFEEVAEKYLTGIDYENRDTVANETTAHIIFDSFETRDRVFDILAGKEEIEWVSDSYGDEEYSDWD